MPDRALNLLTEPLIRVRLRGHREAAFTLPQVLAELSRDELHAFPGLRIHQEHAWHAFLVQLAAIVLHSGGDENVAHDGEWWAQQLRKLTDGSDDPWCLVVDDLTHPAFFQPPVPENSLSSFKDAVTPDALDVLVAGRNHDVKALRLWNPLPDHWLYALVTLQTMEGYSGSGNYGVARMNGRFGGRPCVSYAAGFEVGGRFRRDVHALLESRKDVFQGHAYRQDGGKTLLWLEPWDGTTAISLQDCDPFFIEVCRRVRLTIREGRIIGLRSTSDGDRLAADGVKGNTGDPWTPVKRVDGEALTVRRSGFSYGLVQELLLGDFVHGGAGRLYPSDPDYVLFWCEAIGRRPGKRGTQGFHRRLIRVPKRVRMLLDDEEKRNQLARVAKRRVETVARVQKHVLRPALRALVEGAPEKLVFRSLDEFDDEVDSVFFEELWASLSLDEAEADRKWADLVLRFAWERLKQATHSTPLPSVRSYRAQAVAERLFRALRRKHFPDVVAEEAVNR